MRWKSTFGRILASTSASTFFVSPPWMALSALTVTALPGVAKAEVSLESKSARVEYEAGRVTRDDMKRVIVDAGFEAE